MITEIALLNIQPGESTSFEVAFGEAQEIISSMQGYIEHELQKCIEAEDKYLLIVRWQALEDHTEGFRKSAAYNDWKKLLHHFYDPFPVVEHYKRIY
ncbi:MAG: antibiotic biosynthesis monooxygenase [Bacteroidota bacterium]